MGRLGAGRSDVFVMVTNLCFKAGGVCRRAAAVMVYRAGRSGRVLLATSERSYGRNIYEILACFFLFFVQMHYVNYDSVSYQVLYKASWEVYHVYGLCFIVCRPVCDLLGQRDLTEAVQQEVVLIELVNCCLVL